MRSEKCSDASVAIALRVSLDVPVMEDARSSVGRMSMVLMRISPSPTV